MDILQTVIGGLIGGGLIGFVEFLIRRNDDRHDKLDRVLHRLDEIEKRIEQLDDKGDEREAVSARVRILHFMDELREDRRHSKDSYDQCMSDITGYEIFCDTHPNFRNNVTALTIEHIKASYKARLEKNDFL